MRALGILAAGLLAAAATLSGVCHMRQIVVLNRCTAVPAGEVSAGVAAVARHVTEHFGPAHGIEARVRLGEGPDDARPGEEPVYLPDDVPGEADAAAWHAARPDGSPYGLVPVARDLRLGEHWTASLAHEVGEMLRDPSCLRAVLTLWQGRSVWMADEPYDPVENDEYLIDGVWVSNFVLPAWYDPGAAGRVDYLGRLQAPLTLSPGGYASVWEEGGWQPYFGRSPKLHQIDPHPLSRVARRHRLAVALSG